MLEQAYSLWSDTTQQDVLVSMKPPSPAFGPLLRTVFEAILEVFLMCFMGWLLAKKGILDKKTQKQLNRVNVSLFTPCLLFSKVAFSLTPSKLKELWIVPILFVVVTSVSAVIAFLVGTALRLRRSQRNFAIAAAMFNNSNSLPIALMQSLVVTVPGLKWGKDDNNDAMLGRALGYLVLYSTLGMMLRWSYGVHLLAQSDEETLATEPTHFAINQLSELENDLAASTSTTITPTPSSSSSKLSRLSIDSNGKSSYIPPPPNPPNPPELEVAVSAISEAAPQAPSLSHPMTAGRKRPRSASGDNNNTNRNAASRLRPTPLRSSSKRFFASFPNSPAGSSSPSLASSPNASKITFTTKPRGPFDNARKRARQDFTAAADREYPDDDVEREDLEGSDSEWGTYRPARQPHAEPSSTRLEHYCRRAVCLSKQFVKGFLQFMTMPLYAALASLIVALTPPLQHALTEHLQPVKGFLASAGSCSIPVTLVVLGAYFYQEPPPKDRQEAPAAGTSTSSTLTLNRNGRDAEANNRSPEATNGLGIHAAHAKSPDDPVLPTHNLQVPLSRTTTRTAISDAETDGMPRWPWTLAGSAREVFKLSGVRARLSSLRKNTKPSYSEEDGGGKSLTEGETKTVFGAVISRMIFTPIIVLPMIAALAVFDLHPVFEDPVFVCSTVLLISAPPALTLAQITQAAAGDAFERLISQTIFWSYCIFTPPLTLFYVIIALHFSRL